MSTGHSAAAYVASNGHRPASAGAHDAARLVRELQLVLDTFARCQADNEESAECVRDIAPITAAMHRGRAGAYLLAAEWLREAMGS